MFQVEFVEKIKTHFIINNVCRKFCRLRDNVEKYSGAKHTPDDNKEWRIRFACWIYKATHTPTQYIIHIAFPLQRWFRELASVFRYVYVVSVVNLKVDVSTP